MAPLPGSFPGCLQQAFSSLNPYSLHLPLQAPATAPLCTINMFIHFYFPWEHPEGWGHASFVRSWSLGLWSFVIMINRTAGNVFRQMAFIFFWGYFLSSMTRFSQTDSPIPDRTSWIVLMCLDGFFFEAHSVRPSPSLIALAELSMHLGWSHAPHPCRPSVVCPWPASWSPLTRSPSWLGLTPNYQ